MKEKRNIQTAGFPELDEVDKEIVEKTISSFFDKIEKMCSSPLLILHHKETKKSGLRKQHIISGRLSCAGILAKAESKDWKFLSAFNKNLRVLMRELKQKHQKK